MFLKTTPSPPDIPYIPVQQYQIGARGESKWKPRSSTAGSTAAIQQAH